MRNYKKIRQKPYLYGFTTIGFIFFTVTSVLSLLTILTGISFLKVIITLVLLAISYAISKFVISNPKIEASLFDNKLPKKYSRYE